MTAVMADVRRVERWLALAAVGAAAIALAVMVRRRSPGAVAAVGAPESRASERPRLPPSS